MNQLLENSTMINNRIVIGLFVAIFVGQLVIWLIIDVWLRRKNPRTNKFAYAWLLGMVERALYFISLIMGAPEWIAFWITAKIAITWHAELVKEGAHEKDSYNIFMIGNGLSVLFAILGVWIALEFNLPEISQ